MQKPIPVRYHTQGSVRETSAKAAAGTAQALGRCRIYRFVPMHTVQIILVNKRGEKLMKDMFIKDILGSNRPAIVQIDASAIILDAVALLTRHKIGVLLVVSDESVQGILSERDIIRALSVSGQNALHERVSSIMTAKVEYCSVDDSIDHALKKMTSIHCRHMPVKDGDGNTTTIISIRDVANGKIVELEQLKDKLLEFIQG
ncbi:MAG: CBS domain-containing protein [Magnetococcus sp. MYC-9]